MTKTDKATKSLGIRARRLTSNIAIYTTLSIMAVIWLLPIAWLVISSLRLEPGAYTTYIMPKNYTLRNYTRLFTETDLFPFPRWYGNTLLVAGSNHRLSLLDMRSFVMDYVDDKQKSRIIDVSFNCDADKVLSISDDETVMIAPVVTTE